MEEEWRWWKGKCKSRHAGGRYESQDKGFHTAIEADFEERESAGWNDKNLIWTYLSAFIRLYNVITSEYSRHYSIHV